jgi:hypothetical protein
MLCSDIAQVKNCIAMLCVFRMFAIISAIDCSIMLRWKGSSTFRYGKTLTTFNESIIKSEPMIFGGSYDFSMQHAGPITRDFLQAVPEQYRTGIFDSRVHMLKKGFFPCIPGWHHDEVPRTLPNGQPNYAENMKVNHVMAIQGDICPTQFAVGECDLPIDPCSSTTIYAQWHPLIEKMISDSQLQKVSVQSARLIEFDSDSLHQGTAATCGGWRFFGRMSSNSSRPFQNEVRKQVQVYLGDTYAGW